MKAHFEATTGVLRVIPTGVFGDPYVFVATATLAKPWLFLRGVETMGPQPHRTASAIRSWCKANGFDMVGWEHKGRQWFWHRIKKGSPITEPPKATAKKPEFSWTDGELTTAFGSCRFTRTEADILSCIFERPSRYHTADSIAYMLWPKDGPGDPAGNVRVYMDRIRRKAAKIGVIVECNIGFGYKVSLPTI